MSSSNGLGKLAWVLVIVGALNWGLVGINPGWNLVEILLGTWPMATKVVYILVGLSAVVSLLGLGKKSAPTA